MCMVTLNHIPSSLIINFRQNKMSVVLAHSNITYNFLYIPSFPLYCTVASMQNMILEALQLTLNNALDGSSALEAEIQNYPELIKVHHEASSLLLHILSN